SAHPPGHSVALVLPTDSTAGRLYRAWPARLLLELLPHVPARGALDCRWTDLVRRTAPLLQPGLCCLALADQTSNADDRQNGKAAQLPGDLWLHLRAGSGDLCGAALVASRLAASPVQPAHGLSSSRYQPLCIGDRRLSP